jgi:hypothetical protein
MTIIYSAKRQKSPVNFSIVISQSLKDNVWMYVVEHACNPGNHEEAEAGDQEFQDSLSYTAFTASSRPAWTI